MTNAIVDTSALVNLGHFAHHMPKDRARHKMMRVYGGVEFAIEAMIIYDTIYVDAHSFNENRLLIDPLRDNFDFIAMLPITAAQRLQVQKAVAKTQVSRLAAEPTFASEAAQLLKDHLGGTSYISFELFCHSMQYFDADETTIREALGKDDFLAINSSEVLEKHDRGAPFIVITQMLRSLFYLELQTMFHCNLVLHPFKGIFAEPQKALPQIILDIFNKEVRESRARLIQRWLGGPGRHFSIPLLTEHVLGKLEPGVGLASAINQVRDSKEARFFRQGISELLQSISENTTHDVDEALAALEAASKAWSASLGLDPRKTTKRVNLSIPIVGGLGTDIGFVAPKVRLSSSDKILTFIHTLLSQDLLAGREDC